MNAVLRGRDQFYDFLILNSPQSVESFANIGSYPNNKTVKIIGRSNLLYSSSKGQLIKTLFP
jgi:hypothetical protein